MDVPSNICILNPVNALNEINNHTFEQAYRDAKNNYGASQNLMVGFNEKDVFLRLKKWLE